MGTGGELVGGHPSRYATLGGAQGVAQDARRVWPCHSTALYGGQVTLPLSSELMTGGP